MPDITKGSANMPDIIKVPIVKAGKELIDVDIEKLPDDVYREVMIQGLKTLLNRGMSKITTKDLEGEELVEAQAAAMTKGKKNLDDVYSGKVRLTGGGGRTKIAGVVKTEAMRIARGIVKDTMKRLGIKVSYVEASEITRTAREYLDGHEELMAQAKANVEARQKDAEADEGVETLVKSIKISDKKKSAVEKKKAEAKAQLSAKQAGITAKAKPQGTHATH